MTCRQRLRYETRGAPTLILPAAFAVDNRCIMVTRGRVMVRLNRLTHFLIAHPEMAGDFPLRLTGVGTHSPDPGADSSASFRRRFRVEIHSRPSRVATTWIFAPVTAKERTDYEMWSFWLLPPRVAGWINILPLTISVQRCGDFDLRSQHLLHSISEFSTFVSG